MWFVSQQIFYRRQYILSFLRFNKTKVFYGTTKRKKAYFGTDKVGGMIETVFNKL